MTITECPHIYVSVPMDNPVLFNAGRIAAYCVYCHDCKTCGGPDYLLRIKDRINPAVVKENTDKFGHDWRHKDADPGRLFLNENVCSRCGTTERLEITGPYTGYEDNFSQSFVAPNGEKISVYKALLCPNAPEKPSLTTLSKAEAA